MLLSIHGNDRLLLTHVSHSPYIRTYMHMNVFGSLLISPSPSYPFEAVLNVLAAICAMLVSVFMYPYLLL